MKDQIEKPDWDYKESIKFEKMPDVYGQHWYHLQVRSLSVEGWSSLGVFNQTMIIDLSTVSYTHLSCRRIERCRSRWSPYH